MGRPLFSLRVDDVLIQQIFQKLSDQVKVQSEEIAELKRELASRPKKEEFIDIRDSIIKIQDDYKEKSSNVQILIDQFTVFLNSKTSSMDKLVEEKINQITLSINAAIEKEFEAKENFLRKKENENSILSLRREFDLLDQKAKVTRDRVVQIAGAIDDVSKPGTITHKNAASCVRVAITRDREILRKCYQSVQNMEKTYDLVNSSITNVLSNEQAMPQFSNETTWNRTEPPSFPPIPIVSSLRDILLYVCEVIPIFEAVLREFYFYLQNIDSKVNNKMEKSFFGQFSESFEKTLEFFKTEIQDYTQKKNFFVFKSDFTEFASTIYSMMEGHSLSAATNTKCIACGKNVQRVSGPVKTSRRPSTKN